MAFRSGGRQGVSRMKSQPRQISRVRTASSVSKYGGRVSTRPAPKSTGGNARRNSISSYNRPDGSTSRHISSKSGNLQRMEITNKDGRHKSQTTMVNTKTGYKADSKEYTKVPTISPGGSTYIKTAEYKYNVNKAKSKKVAKKGVSKVRKLSRQKTPTSTANKLGVRYVLPRPIKGAKPKSRSAPKKVAKLSRAKITGKKTVARAGKLSVKGVRMGPKGTPKPQTTTRGGPRGTSTTTRTGGGRVRGGRGRDTNAPYRRDNPRKSLSDEYADLGRIY